jgi:hypothetical protein
MRWFAGGRETKNANGSSRKSKRNNAFDDVLIRFGDAWE